MRMAVIMNANGPHLPVVPLLDVFIDHAGQLPFYQALATGASDAGANGKLNSLFPSL